MTEEKTCYNCGNKNCHIFYFSVKQDVAEHHETYEYRNFDCVNHDKWEEMKVEENRTDNTETLKNTLERIKELEKENAELKARLFCTKETCDNCGFVKCGNFQRQRKSEPCSVYISYKDRITKLKLQLIKAKNIIQKFSKFVNNEVEYDMEHPQEHTDLWNELCEQAEQFLKEETE